MNYRTFRGIRPINGCAWDRFGTRTRLRMLVTHARFVPRVIQQTIDVYLINRTEGPRWPYPWQR